MFVVYAISALLYTFIPVRIELYKRKTVAAVDLGTSIANFSMAADKVLISYFKFYQYLKNSCC